jgi:Holliday junction DNA helicase RuvB
MAAQALGMATPRPKLRVIRGQETPQPAPEDHAVWRPTSLDEYVGQGRARVQLKMHVTAALKRGRQPGHMLLSGPPGLGKTSLAAIGPAIVNEGRDAPVGFHVATGSTVRSQKQLATALAKLQEGDWLFIDEAHQMGEPSEELLGLAMEDGTITVSPSENVEPVTMTLPPFTLVLATTKPAHISQPLRNRCKLNIRMEWYDLDELAEIVRGAAGREPIAITEDAALTIAMVGRETPRITLGIFEQVVAFAVTVNRDTIDETLANKAFDVIGLDSLGLDERDRDYMTAVARWQGRRVGLKTIAGAISLSTKEIEEDIEPYLTRAGLLDKQGRGRCLTKAAYAHLWPKMPCPPLLGLT